MRTLALLALLSTACELDTGDAALAGDVDDGPIFLYYGAYHRADTGAIHWPATLELVGGEPGAEYVLTATDADPAARLGRWLDAGGKLAYKLPRSPAQRADLNLEALLDAGTAANFIADRIAGGYTYVAIDELSWAHRQERWTSGGRYARAFVALLDELAARGLDRRVILYVNSYNNAGRLAAFAEVLRACHRRCRVIASEVYMHIANVMRSRAGVYRPEARPTSCTFNLDCFERLAAEMDRVSPGINRRAITALRLDDAGYNGGRLDSLCKASTQLDGWGGLDHVYGRLHAGRYTRQQLGAGGYTPTRVGRHPGWGAIHQARCLRGLNRWWSL